MKRFFCIGLCFAILFSFSFSAFAAGDSNIDSGGGGMGQGTNQNFWNPGRDGVRVTIVRECDNIPVSMPIDFSNYSNSDVVIHFQYGNKIAYRNGKELEPKQGGYACVVPTNPMPLIVSSSSQEASIHAIRNYFCREGTIQDIAVATGLDYDILVSGAYKILLEPIAYFKYSGVMFAMTATEAAFYNKQTGNGLRNKMVSLTHKNLPLAMFLETADLGFPAWNGSITQAQSDDTIIANLGVGVVRFSEPDEFDPEPEIESNLSYRCDTEVITSVQLTTSEEKTPDSPAYAYFSINGQTYSHTDIYIPEGGSQLAWVKWRTPKDPGIITITISSNCSLNIHEIVAEIVDINDNPPPDPQAKDRKEEFIIPAVPNKENMTNLTWGEWDCWWEEYWVWHSTDEEENGYWCDHGWWKYEWLSYSASLSGTLKTIPDEKNSTASGKIMKSGYGINAEVSASVHSSAPSDHITGAQNVVAYFPEFHYTTYWRLLKRLHTGTLSTFEFQQNLYSTYERPVHFSPVWFPNGNYITYTEVFDAWTPAGMLKINLTDTLTVKGSLFDDWHIRPIE
ncbi:MAG: hypothetical protein HFI05_02950 [Lachnospiraceae bacterium]|jgi:hypothetical protein|nr:hypothetical protein [Lachnospiraceae bacterium]